MERMPEEDFERSLLHPLEAFRNQELLTAQKLNDLSRAHAEKSGGVLSVLPVDLEAHPAQRLSTLYIDGEVADIDTITSYATISNPSFPRMLDVLSQAEIQTNEISRIGEDLASGLNIIVVTNHSDIKDIAEVLAAFYVSLRQTPDEYEFTTNLMLSKMIGHLGFYGEPATDILKVLCDRQYLSFPRTDSIANSKISNAAITAYNRIVRQLVKHRMSAGGNLFAIAPSGTTDKPLDTGNPNLLAMGEVTSGTIKLLSTENTKVLPVAVWSKDDQFIFEIVDLPRHMDGPGQVHAMMNAIADTLNNRHTSKQFKYLGNANTDLE